MSTAFRFAFLPLLFCAPLFADTAADTVPPAPPTVAPARSLMVGDPAPNLSIEAWLKGGPIESFAPGQVYLVDVWATWCSPCLRSAPHLAALAATYKDKGLSVIGLTAVDKRGNSRRAVETLLKNKPELMPYPIAWDKERTTTNAYMTAANRTSIPCAFLIDRAGKIAFIGHPDEVDGVLEQVIAGTHDLATLSSEYKARAEIETKAAALQLEYSAAFKRKDWNAVLEIADKLLAIDPAKYGVMAAMKFRVLVREVGDCEKGYAFARAHFAGAGKLDWMAMAAVAFEIVDPGSKIVQRDVDYALELCLVANDKSGGREAPVLDAIARVHYLKGDLEKAVEFAAKAADVDKNLQTTLEQYRAELEQKRQQK